MSVRRTNEASGKQLVKALRGNMKSVDPKEALLSLEAYCSKNEELIRDILEHTTRPTKNLFKEGLTAAFPSTRPAEVTTVANYMHETFKTLFGKARHMKDGSRHPESVAAVCRVIRQKLGLAEVRPSTSSSSRTPLPLSDLPHDPQTPVKPTKKRVLEVHSTIETSPSLPRPSGSRRSIASMYDSGRVTGSSEVDEVEGVTSSPEATSASAAVYHLDMSIPALVKMTGEKREVGSMKAGPGGFALAVFANGDERATEMPNLMLQRKEKAACKRPAARQRASEEKNAVEPEPAQPEAKAAAPQQQPLDPDPKVATLRMEYRKSNNSVGFRKIWRDEKNVEVKRQLFHVVGGPSITEAQLKDLAKRGLAKLRSEVSAEDVRKWILEEIRKLQPAQS